MIVRQIYKIVVGEDPQEPIFKILGKNLIAGYRGLNVCVIYYLNWYLLVDDYLKEICDEEITLDTGITNSHKLVIVVGSFINPKSTNGKVFVDINKKDIYGFISFRSNMRIRKILNEVGVEKIKDEVEEIYHMTKYTRKLIETWYPYPLKINSRYQLSKKFIFINDIAIKEVSLK